MVDAGEWSGSLRRLLEEEPSGISQEKAPQDDMHGGGADHYRRVGLGALRAIKLSLLAAGKDEVADILDFPSGHGRVLRLLVRAFPKARVTACDIDPTAVQFCRDVFGATPVQSVADPKDIRIEGTFDLIWCGSLLTHLDAPRWPQFLELFSALAQPGAVLVFTTHGRRSVEWLRQGKNPYPIDSGSIPSLLKGWDRGGFGYTNIPRMSGYGISLSTPAWVCRQLEAVPSFKLVLYKEGGWDSHQDVVACVRV